MDRAAHRQKTEVIHTMTNEHLVTRIQAGGNVGENMAQLYDQVKGFICSIAWKYRKLGKIEDLRQEGFLALYDAIDHYKANQGVRFLSYAEYWIRQRIQRYLQANNSCLRLPVNRQEDISNYKRFCSSFQLEYGRKPSEAEIARELWLTLKQVRDLKKYAYMGQETAHEGTEGTQEPGERKQATLVRTRGRAGGAGTVMVQGNLFDTITHRKVKKMVYLSFRILQFSF